MPKANRPQRQPEDVGNETANRQNFNDLDEPGTDQLGENEMDPRGHLEPGVGPRDESGALLGRDEDDAD